MMSRQPPSNLPFIFREVAKNELALLTGRLPEEKAGLLLGHPAVEALKPFATVAVPATGGQSLSGFLALIKSEYREKDRPFPRILTPSPEVASSPEMQEIRDYLIVYDFVETERQVMMCLKRKKLYRARDVELAPASFPELAGDFREQFLSALAEAHHYEEEFAEPGFTSPHEGVDFQPVLARREESPAGLATILHHDLEYRLQALFVAPEHRGMRVGETLVSDFLERGQNSGAMFLSAVIPAGSNFFFYLGRFNFEAVLKFTLWTPPSPDFFEEP